MFILIEFDQQTTWGVDYVWPKFFGFRLGWFAFHIAFVPTNIWLDLLINQKQNSMEISKNESIRITQK
ncbi:MAG: hypothetical protein CSYNP_04179 [Syntrophus sp. SKADARSKE-3]|nr:hypothetical protein [Syntrophus sp. SKADARSKE-3]